jgi:ribosomal protein L9
MRRSCVGLLVVLGAVGWVVGDSSSPAQGYTAGPPAPWAICAAEQHSNEIVEEGAKLLGPANGATVVAGTTVTFSAESGVESPMTFKVASAQALLSSPDIDSGPGASQPLSQYTFTSTKAAATPRTIYWTASFTRTLKDCEEPPVTFTLPPRSLTILPTPAEEAATKKKQEEEATKKKSEEEATAKKKEEEVAAAGTVVLDGLTINVQKRHEAMVSLTCADVAKCAGTLTLTANSTTKKGKKAKTETIGTASFSITAGKTVTIELKVNTPGRALLNTDHGRLSATLTVLKSSPAPLQTHTDSVHLVQQKEMKAKKP